MIHRSTDRKVEIMHYLFLHHIGQPKVAHLPLYHQMSYLHIFCKSSKQLLIVQL